MVKLKEINSDDSARLREEYAQSIEKLAELVRESPRTPKAAYFVLFWADSEITRVRKIEPGFNRASAIGSFELIKTDLIREALEGKK